jgi:hypothetical protein
MKSQAINDLFWAFVVALLISGTLTVVAYVFPGSDASRNHVFEIANGMVEGALGFFAGRVTARQIAPPSEGDPK